MSYRFLFWITFCVTLPAATLVGAEQFVSVPQDQPVLTAEKPTPPAKVADVVHLQDQIADLRDKMIAVRKDAADKASKARTEQSAKSIREEAAASEKEIGERLKALQSQLRAMTDAQKPAKPTGAK